MFLCKEIKEMNNNNFQNSPVVFVTAKIHADNYWYAVKEKIHILFNKIDVISQGNNFKGMYIQQILRSACTSADSIRVAIF